MAQAKAQTTQASAANAKRSNPAEVSPGSSKETVTECDGGKTIVRTYR